MKRKIVWSIFITFALYCMLCMAVTDYSRYYYDWQITDFQLREETDNYRRYTVEYIGAFDGWAMKEWCPIGDLEANGSEWAAMVSPLIIPVDKLIRVFSEIPRYNPGKLDVIIDNEYHGLDWRSLPTNELQIMLSNAVYREMEGGPIEQYGITVRNP